MLQFQELVLRCKWIKGFIFKSILNILHLFPIFVNQQKQFEKSVQPVQVMKQFVSQKN